MTKTINGLTVTTSAASGDFLAIWRAANSDTRKITKSNFIGATLTGAGTISTGGFTLTVPATGTASLLGTAQTYSALKTFSAGIAFAHETLNYYDEGTWTPVVADAAAGGNTATASSAVGVYTRIGNIVEVSARIVSITTTGLTSSNGVHVRGLPFTSNSNTNYRASTAASVGNITFTTTPILNLVNSATYLTLAQSISGGATDAIEVSALSSGSANITFSLTYLC